MQFGAVRPQVCLIYLAAERVQFNCSVVVRKNRWVEYQVARCMPMADGAERRRELRV